MNLRFSLPNLQLTGCSGLLLGVLSCLAMPRAIAEVPLTRADIESIYNEVEFIPEGALARPATLTDWLDLGDALRTSLDARAELRFNDGSLARVGERATFWFVPNTRDFRLSNGTALFLIPPNRGPSNIQTPSAVTGIQGTALVVRHIPGQCGGETAECPGRTVVMMLTDSPKGPAQVTTNNGETVTLNAGDLAVIEGNSIQILQFDLELFYQTSSLVEGLDLNNPDFQGSGSPTDPVRQETLSGIQSQQGFEGRYVLNPEVVSIDSQLGVASSWLLPGDASSDPRVASLFGDQPPQQMGAANQTSTNRSAGTRSLMASWGVTTTSSTNATQASIPAGIITPSGGQSTPTQTTTPPSAGSMATASGGQPSQSTTTITTAAPPPATVSSPPQGLTTGSATQQGSTTNAIAQPNAANGGTTAAVTTGSPQPTTTTTQTPPTPAPTNNAVTPPAQNGNLQPAPAAGPAATNTPTNNPVNTPAVNPTEPTPPLPTAQQEAPNPAAGGPGGGGPGGGGPGGAIGPDPLQPEPVNPVGGDPTPTEPPITPDPVVGPVEEPPGGDPGVVVDPAPVEPEPPVPTEDGPAPVPPEPPVTDPIGDPVGGQAGGAVDLPPEPPVDNFNPPGNPDAPGNPNPNAGGNPNGGPQGVPFDPIGGPAPAPTDLGNGVEGQGNPIPNNDATLQVDPVPNATAADADVTAPNEVPAGVLPNQPQEDAPAVLPEEVPAVPLEEGQIAPQEGGTVEEAPVPVEAVEEPPAGP